MTELLGFVLLSVFGPIMMGISFSSRVQYELRMIALIGFAVVVYASYVLIG